MSGEGEYGSGFARAGGGADDGAPLLRVEYAVVVGPWNHGNVRLVSDQEEAVGLAQRTAQANPGAAVRAVEVRVLADVIVQESAATLAAREKVEVGGYEDWGLGEVIEVADGTAAIVWRREDGTVLRRGKFALGSITRNGEAARA